MRQRTRLIHGGADYDEQTGALSVPIYQVSTFKQDRVNQLRQGYEYSRTANPTRSALEEAIKELESGEAGFAFSSGMAAITAIMMLLKKGDHIVMTSGLYGGTYRIMVNIFNQVGIDSAFVDTSDPSNIEKAIQKNTKAIYVETPTNPLLKVTDIRKAVDIAKGHQLLLIVDNTFNTPYWQNPIDLGADIVVHSATKYIGGHSDVVGGLTVVRSKKLAEVLHGILNTTGGILGPQDSWLLLRGIKTLGVRMEQHEENAKKIANFLSNHPNVKNVYYPGLPSHPGYETAKRQSRGFGGMLSFDVSSEKNADHMFEHLKYFILAESLGSVESLVCSPARMTHAAVPKDVKDQLGITEGLIRVSVGLEDADDLLEDLEAALKF